MRQNSSGSDIGQTNPNVKEKARIYCLISQEVKEIVAKD